MSLNMFTLFPRLIILICDIYLVFFHIVYFVYIKRIKLSVLFSVIHVVATETTTSDSTIEETRGAGHRLSKIPMQIAVVFH